jgi:hypothetical protein
MELFRRAVFIGCLLTSGALAYVTSLAPLITVRFEDFAKELETDRAAYRALVDMGGEEEGYTEKKLSEIAGELSGKSLEKYVAEKTENSRIVKLDNPRWISFAEEVIAVGEGRSSKRWWTRRLPSEQHHLGDLFFRASEAPVDELLPYFRNDDSPLYAMIVLNGLPQYFRIAYHKYSDSQFTMFGFSASPKPPSFLLYPYRNVSIILLISGIFVYLLLPRTERKEGVMAYPRYMIILGDLAALICTLPFFILPFMIVGGFRQAFFEAWPLMAVFWIIASIGLFLFKISAYYASYRLEILEDRLKVSAVNGRAEYPFSGISFFQPVVFKPPKWLIVMMWLAALSGKGASRIGGIGRAMMVEGSEYGALAVQLKNGKTLYINLTNAMGGKVLKGSESILTSLKKAGVEEIKEVKVIRSMGLETMRLPKP